MPKIDITKVPVENRTGYPALFTNEVAGRFRQRLGNVVGLDQFGVNLTRLKPGAWSAQRHWHELEDEFVFVLEGELMLSEDGGETLLKAGEAAGFKSGVASGHFRINRSNADAVYLEIGTRAKHERAHYPDIDLAAVMDERGLRFTRKSGEPY